MATMRKWWWLLAALLLWSAPALAGPGGKIASAMFSTFWGKVALGVLTVVLLPFVLYVMLKERQATARARRDLQYMASRSEAFEWVRLRAHFETCFQEVHRAWREEDVAQAKRWMTDWYWQNQQAQLDRWARDGLRNECELKKVEKLQPLLFVHRNRGAEHEGSSIAVLIGANMKDCLVQRASGKVVEGTKDFHHVDTVWTFVLREGEWRVNGIEEGDLSLAYAKLVADLPPIESTLGQPARQ